MAVTIGELEARLHADVSSFISGMRQAQNAFTQTNRSISAGSASMSSLSASINSVQMAVGKLGYKMNMVFGAIGAGFILPQIFSAAKTAVIDFNQQVDQASVALTNFLGSASASKKMIGELQDFAARTPFQFSDLLGTTQSMMAMGVAAEDVLPRMQAIGDAAAAMGGSPEVLYRIQRALGQIQAKGRVQSEELLQLAEAGIPAYQYIADAMGTTTSELMDSMKKGAIDSTTAVNALLDGMGRDFGGMMEEQSKTMMGAMSTVMDYVQITIGAIFRPFFEALRDSFVLVSNLLSSNSMKEGASKFAAGIASVITSIRSLLAAFAGKLQQPFMQLIASLGNVIKASLRIGRAMKPMVTAVLVPMGAAVVLIAKALAPLVKMLSAFFEVITRNQFVVYALAGLLMGRFLMGLQATSKASGALTNVVARMMGVFGDTGKIIAMYFRDMRQAGMSTGASISAAMKAAGFSVKAFALAVKTALLELLPLVIMFMIVGKAIEAFSNRNKDANERTKELTEAVKSQTDALLQNENALVSMQQKGLRGLNDALVQTGKEGEETTNALINLGKSGSDYLQTMVQMQKDTEKTSYAIAKSNGFTSEQAKQMADYVNYADKGSDEQHRFNMMFLGFTDAMIEATMAMEQLDDASENTKIAELVQTQIDATIRANEATKAFYEQAKAEIAAAEASGKVYTESEKALAVYEKFIQIAGDYEKQQMKLALANNEVGESNSQVNKRLTELISTMKEGKVEAEQFLLALRGAGKNSAVNIQQAYFNMGVTLKQFGQTLKDARGNTNALQQAGYDFAQMLGENQASILSMGGSLGDVNANMTQMIEIFYAQGKAAGFSKTKLDEVLESVGLLQANGEIKLAIGVDASEYEAVMQMYARTLSATGDVAASKAILQALGKLNVAKERSLNLDLKLIDLGGGSSSKSSQNRYQAFLDYMQSKVDIVAEHLQNLKDSAENLRSSIVSAVVSTYSFSNAYSEMTASQDAYTEAQNELAKAQGEVAKAIASRDIYAYQEAMMKLAEASQKVADADSNRLTYMQSLEKQYEKAVQFQNIIQQLQQTGLNEAGIAQVIAAGAEEGIKIGQSLLEGGAEGIQRANVMYDTLKNSAQQTATAVSGEYYNSGITMAESLLKGIKDTVKDFKLKLKGKALSAAQLAKMKKDFNIETEFTMSAVRTAEAATAMASGGIIMPRSGGTLARIGEAGYPEAVIPLNRSVFSRVMPEGGATQNTYEIHVHAGVGDPQEIGKAVVGYLQSYERRYGRIPVKVQ